VGIYSLKAKNPSFKMEVSLQMIANTEAMSMCWEKHEDITLNQA
jgi:hypothetical protein